VCGRTLRGRSKEFAVSINPTDLFAIAPASIAGRMENEIFPAATDKLKIVAVQ
jgi:hypothetical protein